MLEVALWVAGDILLGKPVTGASDENGHVDDEATQTSQGRLESGESSLGRPNIGREVFGKCFLGELRGWLGALERGVDVEGAVGVVRALEGVDLAVFEGFLSKRPAGEILGLDILQLVYGVGQSQGSRIDSGVAWSRTELVLGEVPEIGCI